MSSDAKENEPETCLGEKLSKLAPITKAQRRLLARLEDDAVDMRAGCTLFERGADANTLYIIKGGWVASESSIEEGRRSIVDLHNPGDVVGISHLPFAGAAYDLIALTDVRVCRFERENLRHVFTESPRLSALFVSVSMIEQAILTDRAMVNRRNDALSRLALFILQTKARLSLMNDAIYDRFPCPLTQSEIGAAIGLSSVHVSRMFTRLKEMDLVRRQQGFIQIVDEEKLGKLVEFADRYGDLDLAWLPE